jgi:hypothetical protein
VLRRQAVVDGDDRNTRLGRDLPALDVVRVEVADDPAAAVEIDEHRKRRAGRHTGGSVDPQRDRPAGPVGGEVFDRADLRRCRRRGRTGLAEQLSGVLGRQRVVGGTPRLDDKIDHFLGLGIEGHGTLSCSGSTAREIVP